MSDFLFKKEDVVPCLMSGLKYYSRAKACTETWLRDYEKFYIFGDTPDDSVPITSIPGSGEDWHSHKAKRYKGMEIALRECPDTKWFFYIACDNFIFNKTLKAFLDYIEGQVEPGPAYVGGHTCNNEKWGPYFSGGGGYLLNREAAQILCNDVEKCINLTESEDITTGVLMRENGVKWYYSDLFIGCNPLHGEDCHSVKTLKGAISFHWLSEPQIRHLQDVVDMKQPMRMWTRSGEMI